MFRSLNVSYNFIFYLSFLILIFFDQYFLLLFDYDQKLKLSINKAKVKLFLI